MEAMGDSDLGDSIALADLAKRSGATPDLILKLLPKDVQSTTDRSDLEAALADNLYAGYIKAQKAVVQRLRHHDSAVIPERLNFRELNGLSHEMVERLERARPRTFGDARNIPGLTAAALSTLFVSLSVTSESA
jgi:tRNA uridine 5-carboxymethylaminomethyl modification enzyme